jgi:DAK2 domain fusion protein YloV
VSGYADLDADAVRACCRETLAALGRAREEIDALNVYPVPDGDTGTNLYLTVESALEEVEARPDDGDLLRTLRAATHGALLGARGNSGVILSQLMRGASEVLVTASHEPVAQRTRSALAAAAEAAYAAVAHPVEGTILTVARAAAEAAAVEPSEDFATVLKAAASGAAEALRHTPEQLEPLRRAGVVDAGGRGLVVVLDALVATVTGDRPMSLRAPVALPQPQVADVERRRAGGPAFEVMYLLEARPDAVDRLRAELEPLGDSLLVGEAGGRPGRPYRIAITHFGDQVAAGDEATSDRTRAVIALAPGEGLALLAAEAGARVVHGAPTRRPATRDVLEAIQGAHAREIVVLPNDSDTLPVAEAAAEYARSAGLRVAVIPSRASVQVLAALAVHDPGRHFEDDVVAMTAAARATRHGEVTTAVREALTSAGVCRPGDVLGLLDGDVVMIGADVRAVATDLLDRMLAAGGELVTLVLGEDADPDLGRGLQEHLARSHRSAESCVYLGGQPHYPLLIGVE